MIKRELPQNLLRKSAPRRFWMTSPSPRTTCTLSRFTASSSGSATPVIKQEKPHPKMVAGHRERVHCPKFDNVTGTIVASAPPSTAASSVPGCHAHFIDDERVQRHVVDFCAALGKG